MITVYTANPTLHALGGGCAGLHWGVRAGRNEVVEVVEAHFAWSARVCPHNPTKQNATLPGRTAVWCRLMWNVTHLTKITHQRWRVNIDVRGLNASLGCKCLVSLCWWPSFRFPNYNLTAYIEYIDINDTRTLVSTDQSNPEVKQKERIKYKVLTFQGRPCSLTVICRFDVQREVRRGRIRGRAGRQESSAGASLTHVGQSSVEIRLMNRGERAKRRGYSSFNIPPS